MVYRRAVQKEPSSLAARSDEEVLLAAPNISEIPLAQQGQVIEEHEREAEEWMDNVAEDIILKCFEEVRYNLIVHMFEGMTVLQYGCNLISVPTISR